MLPEWLIKKTKSRQAVHAVKVMLRSHKVHTVCEEANCPNLGECFGRGTATFMILGDICTRNCGFCGVKSVKDAGEIVKKIPLPSREEPKEIAKMVKEMSLKHVVITSVTRDDLQDGGSEQFAKTIREIRKIEKSPVVIEVLTPDFGGRTELAKIVCDAKPDIFNHNLETVERLTPNVRSVATYKTSLKLLNWVHNNYPNMIVKSGLMVGLGETEDEVYQTLKNLKEAGCSAVTIGQYLRPKKSKLEVVEFVKPEQFEKYKAEGERIGIKYMFCGPFVRSSYMAEAINMK